MKSAQGERLQAVAVDVEGPRGDRAWACMDLLDDRRHPVVRAEDADALGGRGLHLLASLASRWGVRPDPPGKVVWFELDSPAA